MEDENENENRNENENEKRVQGKNMHLRFGILVFPLWNNGRRNFKNDGKYRCANPGELLRNACCGGVWRLGDLVSDICS